MNAEEKELIKGIMAKIEGTLNILRNSPEVIAYNKLLGVSQKLGGFLSPQTETGSKFNESNKN